MPSRLSRGQMTVGKQKKSKSNLGAKKLSASSSNGDSIKAGVASSDEEAWKQSRVLRCSYRVLQLIGNATLTEKVIREALGNNPDTSKALRLLLKRKMIKRVGYGGRSCPFHYQQRPKSPTRDSDVVKEMNDTTEISELMQQLDNTESTGAIRNELDIKAEIIREAPPDELEKSKNTTKAPKTQEPKKTVVEEESPEIPVPGWTAQAPKTQEPKKVKIEDSPEIPVPGWTPKALKTQEPKKVTAKTEDSPEIPVPGWRVVSD